MAEAADPLRVVFYSHDSQGLGHFRRNRALAQTLARRLPALTGRPVTGLLVNGVAGIGGSSLPPGFDVVTLPAVGKTGTQYGPRHLDVGVDNLSALRGEIVRATLHSFRPDLVVIDRHPLGVNHELEDALVDLRAGQPGVRIVLGLREVLDFPQAAAQEWSDLPLESVQRIYDEIWVYGDPAVHDPCRTGELPTALHHLVRCQGYLAHGRSEDPTDLQPDVPFLLTTAGGGSDGLGLCLAAAAATVPAGHQHVVITGPQMPDADYRKVERAAGRRTRVVRSVPDVSGLIRRAAATCSMAGYNTVTETLATDVPALFVPREWPRHEQLIRVQSLVAQGVADLVREGELTPEALSAWWSGAVRRRVSRGHLNLQGLSGVARSAARLLADAPASAPRNHQELSVAV